MQVGNEDEPAAEGSSSGGSEGPEAGPRSGESEALSAVLWGEVATALDADAPSPTALADPLRTLAERIDAEMAACAVRGRDGRRPAWRPFSCGGRVAGWATWGGWPTGRCALAATQPPNLPFHHVQLPMLADTTLEDLKPFTAGALRALRLLARVLRVEPRPLRTNYSRATPVVRTARPGHPAT